MTKDQGTGKRPAKPFSAEVRERAVRLVQEQQGAYETQWAAVRSIAVEVHPNSRTDVQANSRSRY